MSAMCDQPDGRQEPGRGLGAERGEGLEALSRLQVLRQDAAVAYDAIMAVEDTLRVLAGQRVAAERSLRAAVSRYNALVKAQGAHNQAKPGLRRLLATGFAARREWLWRRSVLQDAVRDYAAAVDTARRGLSEIRAQLAATVRKHAEATAALRRLTAECAIAQDAVKRGRERLGESS
jgi:hypothetical protein